MAKKKTSARQRDIERLANQYQSQLGGLSGQYQSITSSSSGLDKFQQQSLDYQTRLLDYQKSLEEYQKNPSERVNVPYRQAGRSGPLYTIDGKEYSKHRLPENYFFESVVTGKRDIKNRSGQVIGTKDITEEQLFRIKDVPTFTEEAPVAPDTTERDAALAKINQERKSLTQGFEREIGERKASRIGAVSRRAQSRPMLSKGVTL